jgi:hypothetical protein
MRQKRIAALAVALLLLASGSGVYAETAPEETVYEIDIGGWESGEVWRIDKDGNEVPSEEKPAYTSRVLEDLATGEPRYEVRVREELVHDPEGWANTIRWRSLWDLDGNLLLDWDRTNYDDGFGEYIIRQDNRDGIVDMFEIPEDYHSALYHVPTGKELFVGAFGVWSLEGGDFLLTDKINSPLGVISSSSEVVSGFPVKGEYFNARAWGDSIEADNVNYFAADGDYQKNTPRNYILDKSFNEVFSAEWISTVYWALRGDYAAWRDGEDAGIYAPGEGVAFKVTGASVEYYDGELAIVQTGEFRGDTPISASLVTKGHKELAGGFSWLRPDDDSEEEPATAFLGIKDGKAVRIDRSGNVIAASPELPDIKSVERLCEGLYTYNFETETTYGSGLLGADMKVLIPAGTYTRFYLEYGDSDSAKEAVLLHGDKEQGTNEPGHQFSRIDILDHTGKVILGNVTQIHGSGPDRVAITRGFNTGLIDWNGNWIVKRPIFDNAMED